jgi:YidC/Oxa1 family membrane protein insertase
LGGLLEFWNVGVVASLADALIILTNFLGSYGLAIIVFTIVVKFILLPLTIQQIRSSRAMMEIQPKLKELQKKYGKDRERLMQEQMRLYKEHNVNPAAGCLPMLIQMPVWFGLYQALRMLSGRPEFAHSGFLWIPSLATVEGPPYILAILTGVTQWVVQRMMAPRTDDPQQKTMNQMMQFMPLMFMIFAFQVPAGLVLYWVTSNLFTFAQQYFTTGWGSLVPVGGWGSLGSSIGGLFGGNTSARTSTKAGLKGTRAIAASTEPSSNGSRASVLNNAVNDGSSGSEPARREQEEAVIQQAKAATQPSGSRRKKKGRRR